MDYEVTDINFKTDGGLPIFLAAPTGGGTFPAVVFLHESYGLVRHIQVYKYLYNGSTPARQVWSSRVRVLQRRHQEEMTTGSLSTAQGR